MSTVRPYAARFANNISDRQLDAELYVANHTPKIGIALTLCKVSSIDFAHTYVVFRFLGYKTRVLAPKNTGLVFL